MSFRKCGLRFGLFLKMFSVVEFSVLDLRVLSKVFLLMLEVCEMLISMFFGFSVLIICLLMIWCVVVEVVRVMKRKLECVVNEIVFLIKV